MMPVLVANVPLELLKSAVRTVPCGTTISQHAEREHAAYGFTNVQDGDKAGAVYLHCDNNKKAPEGGFCRASSVTNCTRRSPAFLSAADRLVAVDTNGAHRVV